MFNRIVAFDAGETVEFVTQAYDELARTNLLSMAHGRRRKDQVVGMQY